MPDRTAPSHDFQAIADERRDIEKHMRSTLSVYDAQVREMTRVYGSSGKGLNQQTRLVLAFGMAVYSGTDSAVEWTVTRALNHGVSEEMLHDAINIALLNGGTFAVANARAAMLAIALRQRVARKTKDDFRIDEPVVQPR